ncbi:hypothetical protein VR479_00680 [Aquirufa aurantiipilula]
MKVYVTSTPEVEKNEVDAVVDLLSSVAGPIKFKQLPSMSYEAINTFVELDESFENIRTMSFDGLFELCKTYRRYYLQSEGITKDDYVVILTSIRNEHKWFSSFRGNDIFVDINDWEDYTGKNPMYGIAYQVLENIFQSLMKLNIQLGEVESEPNVHWTSIGCINDMCQNKKDIILKLRTGDICDSCQNRFLDAGNSIEIGTQIQSNIENIRKGLVRKFTEKGDISPKKIEVRKDGKVYKVFIEGVEKPISFEALARTLYVFYLKNLDGVNQYDLKNNYGQLKDLYFKIRRGGDEATLENLIVIGGNSTFYKEVNYINKALNEALGEVLVEFYLLQKVDNVYKISLGEEYISIDKEL